jgi:DNA gyrase/topoisomerase IV subunit B
VDARRIARDGTSGRRSTSAASQTAGQKIGRRATPRARDELPADAEMFETTEYSFETISQRLRESAYLTKGVWITLIDERDDRERSFYFEGGLQSFVRHLNRNKEPLHARPIYVERKEGSDRRSRSRSSTTTRTRRTCWRSPTTSTRSKAAPTSPASGQPSRAP